MHPPDRRLELFFPVVITIAHLPDFVFFSGRIWNGVTTDRPLYLFFPVVIGTGWAQQTTRTFYFSGRNNDHAPARQMTRTFFPIVITIAHPPDFCFFSGRIWNGVTTDRQLYLFFPVVIGTAINW